jgi:hypothetical protein
MLTFAPVNSLQVSVLSKFVGENIWKYRSEGSKLKSYFVNDLNFRMSSNLNRFKSIILNGLVNNILIIPHILYL